MEINPMMVLHGEHEIELHRPLPVAATVRSTSRVIGVHDKGKAALIEVETVSADEVGRLFTNRASLFVRGEGGFSDIAGAQPDLTKSRFQAMPVLRPDRGADLVVEARTLPQQALLYRLSGDRNPLHVDPTFAAFGGFDRPILHGLCSFGIVCKAVVDNALDGVTTSVTRYRARFAGVVFPGETIVIEMWQGLE